MPLDAIRDMAARKFLNNYLEGIGKALELDIDAKADIIRGNILLEGESEPVQLEVFYHVEDEALVLESFRCERLWIEVTLNRYVKDQRIPVEDKMVRMLLKHLF